MRIPDDPAIHYNQRNSFSYHASSLRYKSSRYLDSRNPCPPPTYSVAQDSQDPRKVAELNRAFTAFELAVGR
jgi:hypothetical protein